MRSIGVMVVLAAALTLFLYWLGRRPEAAPKPAEATPAPAPTAIGVSPPAAPPSTAQRTAAPTPKPLNARRAGPAAPKKSISAFEPAARRARVKIVRYDDRATNGIFTVEWTGDVVTLGMDFVDQMRTMGLIRDFDLNSVQNQTTQDSAGRRVMRMTVKVFY